MQKRSIIPSTCLGDVNDLIFAEQSDEFDLIGYPYRDYQPTRKVWERWYISTCAKDLGLLNGKTSAAGLGVGLEDLSSLFARSCAKVLATDIFIDDKRGWRTPGINTLEDLYHLYPFPYPRERLEFVSADMRAIPAPDMSFDFVWSCSSIEHVPSLRNVYQIIHELARILKPGGYALISTEFCLTEPPYLLPSLNAMDPFLFRTLIAESGAFEPVGPVDFTFNHTHPGNAARPRRHHPTDIFPGTQVHRHFSPIGMQQILGASVLVPLAFTLKRSRAEPAPWQSLPLPQIYRLYSDAVEAQERGDFLQVEELLRPAFESPGDIPSQFHLQISRLFLESVAARSNCSPDMIRRWLEIFCSRLPAGEWQDADALSTAAEVALQLPDFELAARLLSAAAKSPGTLGVHSIRLAFRHLHVLARLGRSQEALNMICELFCDSLLHGYSRSDLTDTFKAEMQRLSLSEAASGAFMRQLRGQLDEMSVKFKERLSLD